MISKVRALFLLCACVMVGCARVPAQHEVGAISEPLEFIWVEQYFKAYGGSQLEVPNPAIMLSTIGVAPLEVQIKDVPHCMGTGCPTRVVAAFVRIEKSDLSRAEQVGFRKRGSD